MDQSSSLNFSCHFCDRRFKRLEHAQRHERTHTKETPYKCACGKGFPRGDLLRRHEKSAHGIEAKRRRKSRASNGSPESDPLDAARTLLSVNSAATRSTQRSPSGFTDALTIPQAFPDDRLSTEGTASNHNNVSFAENHEERVIETYPQPLAEQFHDGVSVPSFDYSGVDPFDFFGDGETLLENFDLSSSFLESGFGLASVLQANGSTPRLAAYAPDSLPGTSAHATQTSEAQEQNSISRFGSPLPSIQPDFKDNQRQARSSFLRSSPCWKISPSEYDEIRENIDKIADSLPRDFTLPSRHSLSRFLEGCVKGFFEHMPVLHVPTWSATTAAPDLVLAMAAIGSYFKFEGNTALPLFYAAKAAVMHQIHSIRSNRAMLELAHRSNSMTGSSLSSPQSLRDVRGSVARLNEFATGEDSQSIRLQTMQAILSLMTIGSWGPGQLVTEAIGFQSLLAELVRDEGLGPEMDEDYSHTEDDTDSAWARYIRIESLRRTKTTAYCFTNLQSVAYNVAPVILTSEILFRMPSLQAEWNAKTAQDWSRARGESRVPETNFAEAFRSLFQSSESNTPPTPLPGSAVGNYALIFAILQCIFFLRESSKAMPLALEGSSLRTDDIDSLSRALQNWQSRWENSPESNIEPQSTTGPVAFNSTALLRLAWIRLHSDLGPCRNLASRNPAVIVDAFKSCPPLHRHPSLMPALLHAAHALSVPVRLGVNFVAKTQTLTWSVQHSLCNLECAIFLSKWFEAIVTTAIQTPITSQEKRLISLIRSIIRETGFFREEAFELAGDDQGWERLIRHLSTAVAVLWADVFSGSHIFDLVSTIGTSLNIYAKLLENAHTPINIGAV